MPITNSASYLPTVDEFIAHWSLVNAELRARGEPPAVLRDGRTLAEFATVRPALEACLGVLVTERALSQRLREEREYIQEELRSRLIQLGDEILRAAPETRYQGRLLELPPPDVGVPRYLGCLDAFVRLWEEINADPGLRAVTPLKLARGYRLADFQADVERFRATARTARKAARTLQMRECELGGLRGTIMDWLTQYRCVIRFDLEVGQELLAALPARTPWSYRPGTPPRGW